MLSRDEGDVGDVFSDSSDDDEADMSDTQAEIGSASSDNANLPELDDEVRLVWHLCKNLNAMLDHQRPKQENEVTLNVNKQSKYIISSYCTNNRVILQAKCTLYKTHGKCVR